MKRFLPELYTSFLRTYGYVISVLSLVLTTLAFYFTPNDVIMLKWVTPVALIVLMLFIVLADFAQRAFHAASSKLPIVKSGRKPPDLYPQAIALLLLDKSDLFGHEAIVSIYYQDEDFEMLIGVGFVLTIQREGFVQILVTKKVDTRRDAVWSQIQENNASSLKKLIVKPSVPKQINDIGV